MKIRFSTIPESFTEELVEELISLADVKKGAIICDPFAGAGLVGLIAGKNDIQSVNIEINPRITKIMKKNFLKLKKFSPKIAKAEIIGADSETAIINKKVSAIITSPPFTLSQTPNPPKSLRAYQNYVGKLGRIFKKFLPLLDPRAKIIIVIGRDIFKGKEVVLSAMFIEELSSVGYKLLSSQLKPGTARETKILIFQKKSSKTKYLDLTKSIENNQKVWPGFPPVKVQLFEKIKKGSGWNGTKVSFPIHELTHIDFPYHAFNRGLKGSDINFEEFTGPGQVVRNESKIPDVKFLFFPITIPVTEKICQKIITLKNVRFVGTEFDTLTPKGYGNEVKTHRQLLSRNILIIENLTNLDQLPSKTVQVQAFPLKISADGAPVRVVARYD
jgi:kynurenine formamidase